MLCSACHALAATRLCNKLDPVTARRTGLNLIPVFPVSAFVSARYSTKPAKNLPSTGSKDVDHTRGGRTVRKPETGIIRISNSGKIWESVIGLEVHAQIQSNSKLFSCAPTLYNQPVNSQVSYFDAAIPGTLPVLNSGCVTAGIRASIALKANINLVSFFDRKHYFYADLPAGYQITQHRRPIAQGGGLTFTVRNEHLKQTYNKSSKLVQIQIEQDSGKSLHDEKGGYSLIDLNRCGVGLLELVFSPDLQHGDEAAALARELTLILQTINVSRGRMERGELRVDANISVREPGAPLGTRTEVKNLNSLRSVSRAVEFEVWRQINSLEEGIPVQNETRGFDFDSRQTVSMRDKERKQDYRFMPEPNLPPLVLDEARVREEEQRLPPLPSKLREDLQTKFGLSGETAVQLVDNPPLLVLFQDCLEHNPLNYKALANIILIVVQEHLKERDVTVRRSREQEDASSSTVYIPPASLVQTVNLRETGTINFTCLRELVRLILGGEERPVEDIVEERGWRLITDTKYIQEFVEDCISGNPALVEKYLRAKEKKRAGLLTAILREVNKDNRTQRVDMAVFSSLLTATLENRGKSSNGLV